MSCARGLTATGWSTARVILVGGAGRTGRHFGSRMAFDREGLLYVSLGERGEMKRAQDLGDLVGKIARITDEGAVPPDNPFVGQAGVRPEIYCYGVRNPQGMALNPWTGVVWEQEHGPRGGDEVNILRAGANYGWPVITHGVDYSFLPLGEGKEKPGMEQPLHAWVPSIAPSGMAFYDGDGLPRLARQPVRGRPQGRAPRPPGAGRRPDRAGGAAARR